MKPETDECLLRPWAVMVARAEAPSSQRSKGPLSCASDGVSSTYLFSVINVTFHVCYYTCSVHSPYFLLRPHCPFCCLILSNLAAYRLWLARLLNYRILASSPILEATQEQVARCSLVPPCPRSAWLSPFGTSTSRLPPIPTSSGRPLLPMRLLSQSTVRRATSG